MVLPLLPVTANTGPANRARAARPSAHSPSSVSATRNSGSRVPLASMRQCTDGTAPLRFVDERVAVAVAATVGVETRTRITEQRNEQIAGDATCAYRC